MAEWKEDTQANGFVVSGDEAVSETEPLPDMLRTGTFRDILSSAQKAIASPR